MNKDKKAKVIVAKARISATSQPPYPYSTTMASKERPPTAMPPRIPTMASISIQPTALPSRFEPTNSLRTPFLAGERKADWVERRKKPRRDRKRYSRNKPYDNKPKPSNWASKVTLTTFFLEKRSATQPARGAKITKGRINSTPT